MFQGFKAFGRLLKCVSASSVWPREKNPALEQRGDGRVGALGPSVNRSILLSRPPNAKKLYSQLHQLCSPMVL